MNHPEFLQPYLEELKDSGKAPATVRRYLYDVLHFMSWLKKIKDKDDVAALHVLKESDLNKYLSNYSGATARRIASVLNAFFKKMDISLRIDIKQANIDAQRPLASKDFISNDEFKRLLSSMKQSNNSNLPLAAARDHLIDRNVSIVYLMRYYGLTPSEISSINMDKVNFAQNTIVLPGRDLMLLEDHKKKLIKYFTSIPKQFRPRYHEDDPLFVSFYNVESSYLYDYENSKPKRLSIRAIQEMVKDEVGRAGLRKISAINLRNQCILDALKDGKTDETIITMFNMASSFSLHRYKNYIKQQKNKVLD